ncbi:MAG: DUF1304 domain-containing protein [Dermatophilaceae bacterium]
MHVVAIVLTLLAALLHGYIFVLESLRFDRPATWKIFGVRGAQEAAIARPWAFNQGFYNLFLGVGAAIGGVLNALSNAGTSQAGWGRVLSVYCTAFMLAAALVLVGSDRSKARAAATQGTLPALALLALLAA